MIQENQKGLGIIFHSGDYDRIYHGLSIALATSALGREVKLFFTYWALLYLKKGKNKKSIKYSLGDKEKNAILDKNLKKENILKFDVLLKELKKMKIEIVACTNSMGILNISRDQLKDEVSRTSGLTTFLTETKDFQLLFI